MTSESDIVARLRAHVAYLKSDEPLSGIADDLRRAAEEIERLRASNKDLQAALSNVVRLLVTYLEKPETWTVPPTSKEVAETVLEIARDALTKDKP
jgi:hypothetical protein